MEIVKLYKYEEKFDELVDNYYLTDSQLRFTAKPKYCVALAKADKDRHCILALENEQLVTFFVLHDEEGPKIYTDKPNVILLRAFSTDYNHQGKGYAKQALLLLPDFVKKNFPHITEILLAVNVTNEVAQSVYKTTGYVDEGIRKQDSTSELVIMSYCL